MYLLLAPVIVYIAAYAAIILPDPYLRAVFVRSVADRKAVSAAWLLGTVALIAVCILA